MKWPGTAGPGLTRVAVAAVQALHVLRTAERLPEAAGARSGHCGSGAPLRLMILGDSSAAGVGVAHQDDALAGQLVARLAERHRVEWALFARSGATARWGVRTLSATEAGAIDVAIVVLGVNDVKNGMPRPLWAANTRRILRLLRERHGARRIYHAALPPMGRFPLLPDPLRQFLGRRADRFDAELARIALAEPATRHVPFDLDLDESDMARDGFHPGPAIYAGWAALLDAAIRGDLEAGY